MIITKDFEQDIGKKIELIKDILSKGNSNHDFRKKYFTQLYLDLLNIYLYQKKSKDILKIIDDAKSYVDSNVLIMIELQALLYEGRFKKLYNLASQNTNKENYSNIAFYVGLSYFLEGKYQEALDALKKSKKHLSNFVYFIQVASYYHLEKYSNAIFLLNKIYEIYGDKKVFKEHWKQTLYSYLALISFKNGKIKTAQQLLQLSQTFKPFSCNFITEKQTEKLMKLLSQDIVKLNNTLKEKGLVKENLLLKKKNIFDAFYEGLKFNNLSLIKQCIKEYPELIEIKFSPDKNSILQIASAFGSYGLLDYLLNKGLEINYADKQGRTALHIATSNGRTEIVKYLLSKNAIVDKSSKNGSSPLHMAAQLGDSESIKLLFNAGADINQLTKNKKTPLYIAASSYKVNAFKTLIKLGANLKTQYEEGWTILHIIHLKGFDKHKEIKEMYKFILKYIDKDYLNIKDDSGDTPIFNSIFHNYPEGVQLLINKGCSLNALNHEGSTPLHVAISKNMPIEIIQLMIARRANVNAKNHYGETPLHLTLFDKVDFMNLLINNGAKLIKDDKNKNPLDYAIEKNKPKIVKILTKLETV